MSQRRIGGLLLEVVRQLRRLQQRDLGPLNLGSGQAVLLLFVMDTPGISQDSLSFQAGIDKTTTAKALKKLEISGYILRERCQEDKRRYRLIPTNKAMALRPGMERMAREHAEILLSGFLGNEIERVSGYLSRIQANLRRELSSGNRTNEIRKPTAWD